MISLPQLNEDDLDLLVSHSLERQEEIGEAIVNAFHALDIDVFKKPTQLNDWINTDAFDDLSWDSDRPLYLSTRIWDRQVVISGDEVRIYRDPILRSSDSDVSSRMTDSSDLVEGIVEIVAEYEDVHPEDLPTLEEVLDSTTFTKLTTRRSAQTEPIIFTYVWYDIIVDPDGAVAIMP